MPLWNPPHPLQTTNFPLYLNPFSFCVSSLSIFLFLHLPISFSHGGSLSVPPCLPASFCAALNVNAKSCWHRVYDVCVPVTKPISTADFPHSNSMENCAQWIDRNLSRDTGAETHWQLRHLYTSAHWVHSSLKNMLFALSKGIISCVFLLN